MPRPVLDETLDDIALRPATKADLPLLRELYAASRLPELALLPWTLEQRRAFTDEQFRLQHSHFVQHFARADFWMIVQGGIPIGRLYLDRASADWRIVDILLSVGTRGQGIGTALIAWMKRSATTAGARGIALTVAVNNPRAHALYRRLGFVDTGVADGMHQPMRWPSTTTA